MPLLARPQVTLVAAREVQLWDGLIPSQAGGLSVSFSRQHVPIKFFFINFYSYWNVSGDCIPRDP